MADWPSMLLIASLADTVPGVGDACGGATEGRGAWYVADLPSMLLIASIADTVPGVGAGAGAGWCGVGGFFAPGAEANGACGVSPGGGGSVAMYGDGGGHAVGDLYGVGGFFAPGAEPNGACGVSPGGGGSGDGGGHALGGSCGVRGFFAPGAEPNGACGASGDSTPGGGGSVAMYGDGMRPPFCLPHFGEFFFCRRSPMKKGMLIERNLLQHLAAHVLRPNEHAFELVGDAVLHGTGPQTSMGSMRSVATPSAAASAHTHAIGNYVEQDCFVGWPSGEDMRWVMKEAIEQAGAFRTHLCVALEGTYAVTTCPGLHALGALGHEQQAELLDDVYDYFSSRHGHRCGRGAVAESFPCALYFLRLAARYAFDGGKCEQFAGQAERCAPRSDARRAAAGAVPGRVFHCTFVPHRLSTGAAEYRYADLRAAPEAHRQRIRSGAYKSVRVAGRRRVRIGREW